MASPYAPAPERTLERLLELVRSEGLDEATVGQMFTTRFVERFGAQNIAGYLEDFERSADLDHVEVTSSNDLYVQVEVPRREGGKSAIVLSVDDRGVIAALQIAAAQQPPPDVESISDLASLLEDGKPPGVSFASVRDGEIGEVFAAGLADADERTPVTEDSLFQAGSISKPVTALAALCLVDEGRIDLDDDVSGVLESWALPSVDGWSPAVSLRALLTHTAGLSVWGFPGYESGERVPSLVGVLQGEGNSPPIQPEAVPGLAWRYSGGGYTVMQQILIDLCQESFPSLVRRLVFDPLGMTNSTFEQPLPEHMARRAVSGHHGGSPIPGKWHIYPELAAAGLWTTASDLARFALGAEALLSDGLALDLVRGSDAEPGMGLGIMLEACGGDLIRAHAGGNSGFIADMAWTADGRVGAVAMTNASEGYPVIRAAFQAVSNQARLEGLLPARAFVGLTTLVDAASRSVAELSDDGQRPLVVEGAFKIRDGLVATVRAVSSDVELRVGHQPPLHLCPSAEGGWTARHMDVHLTFDGADRARLVQRGRSFDLTLASSSA